jgi:FAD/FMN-containing dehydrogenase/SAM-dependent methyltransferase
MKKLAITFLTTLSLALLLGIVIISSIEIFREEIRESKNEQIIRHYASSSPYVEDFAPFLRDDRAQKLRHGELADNKFFSGTVANMVDNVLYKGEKYSIRKPSVFIWSRFLSVAVFPWFAISDVISDTAHGVMEAFQGEEHLKQASRSFEKAKSSFLGICLSPAGLISPDLVSHHFVTNRTPNNVVLPYGKLYSSTVVELFPTTPEEVRDIILKAKETGRQITFAGALMSQGKQALPANEGEILVNLSLLNQVAIEGMSARVGAGATWGDLQKEANKHGLAVKVMQASNIFSIGGSLGVNCHGWDHKSGALSETVKSILLVRPDGEIVRLHYGDDLFHLVVGGLGGFGAIVEAEISLTPNRQLLYYGEEVALSNYLEYFREKIQKDESIAMHYYRLSLDPDGYFRTGVAANYSEMSKENVVSHLKDEHLKGARTERIKLQLLRRVRSMHNMAWNIEKREALKSFKTTRNEAMRPPINLIFNHSNHDVEWLQEYFVKGEELDAFLKFLSGILKENEVQVYNASVRYVKNNSSALTYAKDGDMFAVVLFFNQSMLPEKIHQTRLWVRTVTDYLNAHGGTYYLPYHHFATREQFRKSYPEWKHVLQKKKENDPEGLIASGFYEEYFSTLAEPSVPKNKIRSIFVSKTGREDIERFLKNVFMQLKDEKFFQLIDGILEDNSLDDKQIYDKLVEGIHQATPGTIGRIRQILHSLKLLKEDLSSQVQTLIGKEKINGYVEIGYPGRLVRPLKEKIDLTGPIYVVNETESLTDYIESGYPRPYNCFVPLNDYDPIKARDIPSGSVDLVACYIGLHHAPVEKLVPFLRSIHRILSPGGTFILMDHDAYDDEKKTMVDVVHSIFNAGTGVSTEDEASEYRNFHSLKYWTALLEKEGFRRGTEKPLIRDGDPTLNSIIKFQKIPNGLSEIEKELKKNSGYERPGLQTYLTAPEWQNVRVSQAYGDFIEHTPFYEFPYFSEVANFWQVFGHSWSAARRDYSFWEVASSEYTLMNCFIGVMMTTEYTLKGVISAPFAWLYGKEEYKEASTIHLLAKEVDKKTLDPRARIVERYPNEGVYHMEIPRYKPFTEILLDLAEAGTEFITIAGQSRIQIDLFVPIESDTKIPKGCALLYKTPAPADPSHLFLACDVEVKELGKVLNFFRKNQVAIVYIHDY